MPHGRVHRCATCGAPLEGVADRSIVRCPYCRSENRLVSIEVADAQARSARFTLAADETQQMAGDLEARSAELLAAYERAQERALTSGDSQAARDAVCHFEGYLRLQYAPTIHLYRSWDPDDPQIAAALTQIDDAVDAATRSVAESLGVTHRSARERLGGGLPA